ncbi:hypothetical protein NYR54_04745 [Chelativorans sp. SCAU2101]|uniref:Uncharacterized protein n=1 Tax=Chelativorans petroleitrophicus TaxID=2975484 RepID=A0A9X2X7P1_9HYPH|nr:hypothetical protein [Chelativorans petroleitrophicus]MCT8989606.1 hypothetical protein [Chelativorans petroleitrophicus]
MNPVSVSFAIRDVAKSSRFAIGAEGATVVILQEDAGAKCLIQHSAGSGKTSSMAWSTHFLAHLHDEQDRILPSVKQFG